MPPFVPVPGVMKQRIWWTVHSLGAANILHWSYSGGPPLPADCAAFATQWLTEFDTSIKSNFGTDVAVVNCEFIDIASDTGAQGQDLTEHAGSVSSPIVGSQIAACTRWPVSLRYRGGHPKTFWPSLPQSYQADPSNWQTSPLHSFDLGLATLRAGMVGFSHGTTTITGHVAVSYTLAHAPRITPLVLALGDGVTDPRFGSQRRRRNQPVSV